LPNETEAVILDITFPSDGMVHLDKPAYLILRGIDGGSIEGFDDPIAYWKALGDPNVLSATGKEGYVMMLLTQKGGHVGWPTGWMPWNTRWEWMNNAAGTFIKAAKQVKDDVNSSSLVDNRIVNMLI